MKIQYKEIFKAFGVFIFGVIIVFGTAKLTDYSEKNSKDDSNKTSVSCESDSLSYKSLITEHPDQLLKLVSVHTPMSAKDGQFVNSQVVVTKSETSTSKIACGYLFVKAGTTKYGPLQSYENLYINPNDFGGHIDKKGAISQNDGPSFSEYLYSLSKIDYWRSPKDRTPLKADWTALFNVSYDSSVTFKLGLNAEESTGFVDEMSIAYKCWNPKTGEENHDCSLQINNI